MTSKSVPDRNNNHLFGTLYAVVAFGLWGILPVYWKLLQRISPLEIVVNRIFWTSVFTGILLVFLKKTPQVKKIWKNRAQIRGILICAILLGVNWLTFIYAVNSGHVLDASMGYYINPLISVFLGILVLKERVNTMQKAAIFLALGGVSLAALEYGELPWIALVLAFTFGLYGLFKKTAAVDPVIGLTAETALMVPLSLVVQTVILLGGGDHLLGGTIQSGLLLVFTGVVTAVPLLFFTAAAQRIPLSRVGFLQYLTPTCFFLLGRFLYQEPFTQIQLASFICIWVALLLYSFSGRRHPGVQKKYPHTRN